MGPAFGPVFPRVGGGIGADEVVAPLLIHRVARIVVLQGLAIVLALVAEQAAEFLETARSHHQPVPEEVAGFMAQMAHQRPVGLVQGLAAPGTLGIVGLHHVQRDGAVGMAGHHGRMPGQVGQQLEARPILSRPGTQPQAGQRIEQLTLGGLDPGPAQRIGRV